MSDRSSVLRKFEDRLVESGVATATPSSSETDDLGAFGWLRGIKDRAIALELRKKDGNIVAFSYGYVSSVEFDPSEGITLHAAGQAIRIKGRNLNAEVRPTVRLYEGLVRQRVPWVRESDRAENFEALRDSTIVDAIEF